MEIKPSDPQVAEATRPGGRTQRIELTVERLIYLPKTPDRAANKLAVQRKAWLQNLASQAAERPED